MDDCNHPRETARDLLRQPRTFADVPRSSLQDASTGALVLYVAMRAWGALTNYWTVKDDRGSAVQTPPGGWHAAIGNTSRAVATWRGELIDSGHIRKSTRDHGPTTRVYLFDGGQEAIRERGDWCRVYTAPLMDSRLPMRGKRAWIALSSFAGTDGACFPSIAALADRMDRDARNTRRGVSTLRARGYVDTKLRRGSSLYKLRPGRLAPVKSSVEQPDIGVNESPPPR